MSHSSPLLAISPLDGRYAPKLEELRPIASEAGLIHYRIRVEAAWLLQLAKEPIIDGELAVDGQLRQELQNLSRGVIPSSAAEVVKKIEATTNHDVKAVEYFLRDRLMEFGANSKLLAHIHFACTSEDINNLAYGLMLKETRDDVIVPSMDNVIQSIDLLLSLIHI